MLGISPYEPAAIFLSKHFFLLGSYAGIIESIILGLGVLAALKPHNSETNSH